MPAHTGHKIKVRASKIKIRESKIKVRQPRFVTRIMPHRRRDSSGNLNINSEIVDILEDYDKEIPVDFLARELCRTTPEIRSHVEKLKGKGIVNLHNNNISINREAFR